MPLPIVHHPAFDARFDPAHRFPMSKFSRLAEILVEDGLVPADGWQVPVPAPAAWLRLAHSATYVDQVLNAAVPREIEKAIGFPVDERVALRSRAACGGTVLTARLALEQGLACNTAGGSHHARREAGAGFSVFNDVAVAARVLLADREVNRVLVVDCDVHQGDGTARIFEDDERVFTLSIHAAKNYPSEKARSDLDVELSDGIGDATYLDALMPALAQSFDASLPDLVFFNAGVDPHAEDRLGRLSLSDEGLMARDRAVIGFCREAGVPVACVLGGGYSRDIDALARRHSIVHRAATAEFSAPSAGARRREA
ncbi:histone deacetylase family protein [Antarcticirhabdus aurantiaca]|uniref:Histone deacetylase n=1 Tax=Antarcticirhabdus aurantiaca TaxID=2606717 RepID=A0ACD4NUA8_9HYPH|nr:histone deacetylase [Antarcticirhabdus aurantiaca]WAJ30378.1 histone deacetylase [Jeongeuplla avenae]